MARVNPNPGRLSVFVREDLVLRFGELFSSRIENIRALTSAIIEKTLGPEFLIRRLLVPAEEREYCRFEKRYFYDPEDQIDDGDLAPHGDVLVSKSEWPASQDHDAPSFGCILDIWLGCRRTHMTWKEEDANDLNAKLMIEKFSNDFAEILDLDWRHVFVRWEWQFTNRHPNIGVGRLVQRHLTNPDAKD